MKFIKVGYRKEIVDRMDVMYETESNYMHEDTTKVNLKRVKKRRLKGGRKINGSKDLSEKRNT